MLPRTGCAVSTLKVLHVIPSIAPRYGGPSEVICSMVAALNRGGVVTAEVAATDADGPGGRLSTADVPAGMKVHLFPRNFSEEWKFSRGLRTWLGEQAGEYDLVHIHSVWSFASAAAARAAARRRVPYIVRPAGMLSDYSWNRQGWKKQAYWKLIENRTFREAAAFQATSEAEASEIRGARADARVYVIPNGVEDSAFTTPRDATSLRQLCGPAAGELPILLFLSRLHPKKGIVDRLLPAVAAMRSPAFLAIVGGDDPHAPGYADEVRRAIDRLGIRNRVSMLGPVTGGRRWAMFDGAAAFVLPSHSENFGVAVAEAMARACPVVVTDAVQSCTHVRAAECGDVVTGDVTLLAAALDRVVAESEPQRAIGARGREYAERHFRWAGITEELQQMYLDCLAGAPRTTV